MKQVLLLSDTHSFLDERIIKHCNGTDEIWHAGDIGNLDVSDRLKELSPTFRGVYGNIDDHKARTEFPKNNIFQAEDCKVLITHIGGPAPKYHGSVAKVILEEKPQLFVCGHSHILKVFFNKTFNCLHLNPGAIGTHGFHTIQTALKFKIDGSEIKDMNIIELERRKRG
jgi:hypothetical protein